MTDSSLAITLLGSLGAGAGGVWLFMVRELRVRDDKLNRLESLVLQLTAKLNRLEGRNEAEDSFLNSIHHIDSKLDQLIKIRKTKKN